MTVSTTSGIIPANGEIIYEAALFVAQETTMMTPLVKPYGATGFMQRIVPINPTLTAQQVAEGVDYTNAQAFNKSTQLTLTPIRVAVSTVLTDQRLQTDQDDARIAAGREMGNALSMKVDQDLLGLFDNFGTFMGTAGSVLTLSHVGAALARIRNAKAPGSRSVVLHPYQWHDIWTQLGQPAAQQAFLGDVANQALKDNYVGSLLAASWFISANISADANDDAYGAAFTREAIVLDTRKPPTMPEPEYDQSLEGYELYMSAWYAVGVERSTFGVGILSDVTAPTG